MSKFVVIKRKVLFGDCDPAGIVYTPRFAVFAIEAVDSALAIMLGGSGGISSLMAFDILPPARSFSLEFLHPVTWDDELNMRVSVKEVRVHAFSFLIEGSIQDSNKGMDGKETLAFRAELTQVCVSPQTKKTVEIPPALKAKLL